MNRLDPQLERLFGAAAAVSGPVSASPAYGLETRVLAAWHSSRGAVIGWDRGVLVRGLALAGVLMAVSIWPAVQSRSNSDSEYLQFADSTVQSDLVAP